jgi:GntR family transcriptional regulator, histidine utilization repressor
MPEFNSWQSVRNEVLRRINSRQWKPGDLIPNEADLSLEFGCARATVSRALRGLAEAGLLDRKRKGGTRVAVHPVRKATLEIPVIRHEIEGKGSVYRYSMVTAERKVPTPDICARMQVKAGRKLLHIVCIHMADGRPYVFENRWINPDAVPEVEHADFTRQSPNEWLVANVPFEGGDIGFTAITAGTREAELLSCEEGEGLFVIDRSTWNEKETITAVRLTFAPGYRMHTEI